MPSGAPVRARLRQGPPWGCSGGRAGLVPAQARDSDATYAIALRAWIRARACLGGKSNGQMNRVCDQFNIFEWFFFW